MNDQQKLTQSKLGKRKARHIGPVLPLGYTPQGLGREEIKQGTRLWLREATRGGERVLVHLLEYATHRPASSMQKGLLAQVEQKEDEALVVITQLSALSRAQGSPYGSAMHVRCLQNCPARCQRWCMSGRKRAYPPQLCKRIDFSFFVRDVLGGMEKTV